MRASAMACTVQDKALGHDLHDVEPLRVVVARQLAYRHILRVGEQQLLEAWRGVEGEVDVLRAVVLGLGVEHARVKGVVVEHGHVALHRQPRRVTRHEPHPAAQADRVHRSLVCRHVHRIGTREARRQAVVPSRCRSKWGGRCDGKCDAKHEARRAGAHERRAGVHEAALLTMRAHMRRRAVNWSHAASSGRLESTAFIMPAAHRVAGWSHRVAGCGANGCSLRHVGLPPGALHRAASCGRRRAAGPPCPRGAAPLGVCGGGVLEGTVHGELQQVAPRVLPPRGESEVERVCVCTLRLVVGVRGGGVSVRVGGWCKWREAAGKVEHLPGVQRQLRHRLPDLVLTKVGAREAGQRLVRVRVRVRVQVRVRARVEVRGWGLERRGSASSLQRGA
eukprot:scaffold33624_cov63-Phaeocystis_antarctica.AAC.2